MLLTTSPHARRTSSLAAALTFAMTPLAGRAQPAPVSTPRALDSLITARMNDAGVMGLAAAVIVNQRVVWSNGYGYRDWQRRQPFTVNTIMNAGSIAKTVLGVAMMRAVSEGRLSLDADINTYLPFRVVNPHQPSAVITLRHLATHTSSITDRWDVYRTTYRYDGDARESLEHFLRAYFSESGRHYSRDNFLPSAPGTMREYSNIGAALAGLIVERAVGMPLNTYTRRHIFTPLGMSSTGWFLREIDRTKHSTLFVSQEGHTIPIPLYGGTTYPDGGLRTSVHDLSRFFCAMLRNGELGGVRVLDASSAAEMRRFQFTDTNRPGNFPASNGNSGLFWRTKFNGTRVGHGGNDPGVQTEMLANLDGHVAVVLLVNTSVSGSDQGTMTDIFDALWAHAESLRGR